jgi:hypothetical protein
VLSQLVAYAEQVDSGVVEGPTCTSVIYRVPPEADI